MYVDEDLSPEKYVIIVSWTCKAYKLEKIF